jgi:hypothetical protein
LNAENSVYQATHTVKSVSHLSGAAAQRFQRKVVAKRFGATTMLQSTTRIAQQILSSVRPLALVAVLASAALFCQTAPGHPDSTTHPDSPAHPDAATHPNNVAIEFPVVMRQNIIAGKTPVGTRVQAKLTLATFVKGVVIPEDATLSVEVFESAEK